MTIKLVISKNVLLIILGVENPDQFLHVEGFDHDEAERNVQEDPRPKPQFGTHDPETLLHGDSGTHDNHPRNILKKVRRVQ